MEGVRNRKLVHAPFKLNEKINNLNLLGLSIVGCMTIRFISSMYLKLDGIKNDHDKFNKNVCIS